MRYAPQPTLALPERSEGSLCDARGEQPPMLTLGSGFAGGFPSIAALPLALDRLFAFVGDEVGMRCRATSVGTP